MNLSDVRTMGVTAVTATSVALITVVVYEGHVNVSGAGQTVFVNPGTTMTIEPGRAPIASNNVGGGQMAPTVPATARSARITWSVPDPIHRDTTVDSKVWCRRSHWECRRTWCVATAGPMEVPTA